MTLPGFASVLQAWWFLLLIPLVIFYFLKLRRPRQEIPSLALWRQVISDQRVNSPFQRFKRNLLLLLQALLLCLLVLGAMRPYLTSGGATENYLPILIDTSASMGALDQPGGATRLAQAKEKAARFIDDMLSDQQICLISVNSSARRLTDFTNNKRVLHEALSQLEASHLPSHLEDGFRVAQALSRAYAIKSAVLLSDGNIPTDLDLELPFKLVFQRVGNAANVPANVGIVDLNARRARSGWDVFARLEGSAAARTLAEYELLQNGQVIKTGSVSLEAVRESVAERLVFRVATETAATLELRLKPDGFDALESDNVAYLALPAPRPLAVYCPEDLTSFRNALANIPDLALTPGNGDVPAAVDLKFVAGPLASGPTAGLQFHVGYVPEELSPLVEIESGLADIVDWQRTSPLLQHVQLLDVQIADQPRQAKGVGERDYELAGFEILAQSGTGPLIVEKPTPGQLDIYCLFHPDRSSLVYRVGFPILVQNLVQMAMTRAGLLESKGLSTGTLPAQRLKPDLEYTLKGPHQFSESMSSDHDGFLVGLSIPYTGVYELQGGSDSPTLGVSLLSARETSLAAIDTIKFPEVAVTAVDKLVRTERPLWGWCALAGLGLLMVEWWYFQKRPSGVPA